MQKRIHISCSSVTLSFDHCLVAKQMIVNKINCWLLCPNVSKSFESYYLFHVRVTYSHILLLYVSRNVNLLKKKGIYKKGFTAHAELSSPSPLLPANRFFN